jgi:hypothetical protein
MREDVGVRLVEMEIGGRSTESTTTADKNVSVSIPVIYNLSVRSTSQQPVQQLSVSPNVCTSG